MINVGKEGKEKYSPGILGLLFLERCLNGSWKMESTHTRENIIFLKLKTRFYTFLIRGLN